MRKEQTPAEAQLWQYLKGKQLNGYKVRRQQAFGFFVADFYIADVKLIIEVDGEIHRHQQEYDAQRTQYLEEFGLHVLRIQNGEIFANIEATLERILTEIDTLVQNRKSSKVSSKQAHLEQE